MKCASNPIPGLSLLFLHHPHMLLFVIHWIFHLLVLSTTVITVWVGADVTCIQAHKICDIDTKEEGRTIHQHVNCVDCIHARVFQYTSK